MDARSYKRFSQEEAGGGALARARTRTSMTGVVGGSSSGGNGGSKDAFLKKLSCAESASSSFGSVGEERG
ncbi:hypothetical protein HZH66_007438 [Vespula vulgaris]|uniref:Uncharacterized protein n=1 Tax=Vespula vulgaris TaxID=7454 RepID=A0A834JY75_VESVU|nr:hypothetical protein HZH66_007438 [Vespula vulgaris]